MSRIFAGLTYLILAASAFGAEPKWLHSKSADFEIFSSASAADTKRVAQHFERVHNFFDQAFPNSGITKTAEPVRIVVFGSKKEYDLYRPNEFAIAYYAPIAGRDYIVLGGVTEDVFPTAVHEYVHLVMQHAGFNMPPWLNEGLAEVYSTMKPSGDKVLVGTPILGRIQEIQNEKWVPLSIILAADHDSPYYNEKNKAGNLYNEGWALTHMLQLTPEYGPKFTLVVNQINKGVSSQAAIESVYGRPVAAFDTTVQAYLRRDSFTGRLFPVKIKDSAKADVEPAEAFEVKLSLLDLNNRRGREAETRKGLEELASAYPKRPETQSALGYLDWRENHPDHAVKAFTAAFDLGGRNPQMLWDYGRLAGNYDVADSVRALSALLQLDPSRLEARMMLARIELSANRPKDAADTLAAIKTIKADDAAQLFELRAYVAIQSSDRTEARVNALQWFENAKDSGGKDRAKSFINSLVASAPTVRTLELQTVNAPPGADSNEGTATAPARSLAEAVKQGDYSGLPAIEGKFTELECSKSAPLVVVIVAGNKMKFLLDEPDKVDLQGAGDKTMDMNCGPQKLGLGVKVRYEELDDPREGIKGRLRGMHFVK